MMVTVSALTGVGGKAQATTVTARDDNTLIRAAQAGDRGAFDELVARYDENIHRLARNLMRSEDDAWDVYQETFLKAYRALPRFRFECSFYTWVYRIAANTCMDALRRRAGRREVAAQTVDGSGMTRDLFEQVANPAPDANPEQMLLSHEVGERIEWALRRLSPRERLVFELKHYQGLKLRTIGDMLATSEETAKNSLFRATQKLRGALAGLASREPASRRDARPAGEAGPP